MKKIKLEILNKLASNNIVLNYLNKADKYLEAIGYTEHGTRHSRITGETAAYILKCLHYPQRDIELAATAGFLHDIGNFMGREPHPQFSALLAQDILQQMNMPQQDIIDVMCAIASHEEEKTGTATDAISAAVVIADKSDVHRSRVRNLKFIKFDVHDRVNYAVTDSKLSIDDGDKIICLDLTIDTEISPIMEYFEIFLSRMVVCRRAAQLLKCSFRLIINNQQIM
jgi:metal-dependent HD superfamily phosphatase/phosphodiesterase